MIVLDASAIVEWLLRTPKGLKIGARIGTQSLHVPELADVEVLHVLRRLAAQKIISSARATLAVTDLSSAPLHRYPHTPMLARVWSFRGHISAYDGIYVALAEALGAPLLSGDARLARATGHAATIESV